MHSKRNARMIFRKNRKFELFRLLFFIFLFLTQFLKKLFHHPTALFFQNSRCQFHLMIELFHIQKIQDRTRAARLGIHTPDYHPFDPRLHDRSGTHLARLQCHIHGAVFQSPVIHFFACFADRLPPQGPSP